MAELVELAAVYAQQFFDRLDFYMQSDRAEQMPWALRIALATPEERRALPRFDAQASRCGGMNPAAPTWGEIEDFLGIDGWRELPAAARAGGRRSASVFFEKVWTTGLSCGPTSHDRAGRPSPGRYSAILRRTDPCRAGREFWDALRGGQAVERPVAVDGEEVVEHEAWVVAVLAGELRGRRGGRGPRCRRGATPRTGTGHAPRVKLSRLAWRAKLRALEPPLMVPADIALDSTLALIAIFGGIGVVVNGLIVYIVAQVLGERPPPTRRSAARAASAWTSSSPGACPASAAATASSRTVGLSRARVRETAGAGTVAAKRRLGHRRRAAVAPQRRAHPPGRAAGRRRLPLPLVPGLKLADDARRPAARSGSPRGGSRCSLTAPPGLYAEVASEPDVEEALWLAFQVAYLGPLEGEDPFAAIRAARVPWSTGELPDLGEAAVGPARSSRPRPRGAHAPDGLPRMGVAVGSQAAAFAGEPHWTPPRRFERAFERLALPGLQRAARFDLLVTLGRLARADVSAGTLALSAADDVTVAAKAGLRHRRPAAAGAPRG